MIQVHSVTRDRSSDSERRQPGSARTPAYGPFPGRASPHYTAEQSLGLRSLSGWRPGPRPCHAGVPAAPPLPGRAVTVVRATPAPARAARSALAATVTVAPRVQLGVTARSDFKVRAAQSGQLTRIRSEVQVHGKLWIMGLRVMLRQNRVRTHRVGGSVKWQAR